VEASESIEIESDKIVTPAAGAAEEGLAGTISPSDGAKSDGSM
jgi:hypothetical protein